ncbi:single-stranded DNA-binding protein [Alteribacter lacisalsi]|uniref:Single-stranded DNA-binding protein n=1 Tax=Alteribacter lacisalsi TaxID=2045244 RepID=A0A2W0HEU7_9BACI|nr:single-stranded DNA-binding protein [Alteribacter lacisalsi]PYZ95835.1 single-stranded DNA-binding protein [Alteribacter lacisalsi]
MLNQVSLVGRLARDPELYFTKGGVALSKFTVAVQRNYRNPDGEYDADFVPCVMWKGSAERLTSVCGKGSMISVNGRLQTSSYTNTENRKIYKMDMIAEAVHFLQIKPPELSTLKKQDEDEKPEPAHSSIS